MVWFLLFSLAPPARDTPHAPHLAGVLERQARDLAGARLSREELDAFISTLPLDLRINQYAPDVEYRAPSDWSVVLRPQQRSTYASRSTPFFRVVTLDFHRFVWPDIRVDSGNWEEDQGSAGR